MLSFDTLMVNIPDSVKNDIADFNGCLMKTGNPGIRVTLDRLLSDEEKSLMRKNKHIIGVDCTCHHRYAPEIVKSYFYVV